MRSTDENLAYMADQIARNFAALGHDAAVTATADHIATFWSPAMKRRAFELLDARHEALTPFATAALRFLQQRGAPAHQTRGSTFAGAGELGRRLGRGVTMPRGSERPTCFRLGLVHAGLVAALATPAAAWGQAGEIVVTGRGLEAAQSERVLDEVTIPRDRLAGSAGNRLEDVLRDAAGFQLFRRSDARSANPTSQGATLRGLGGNASSRLLLLLDGVPQSDPFGGWISWPAYDPLRLGSARVTRGGGSGVQGPGALAGTIELASADPADLAGLRTTLGYGSRDSVDAHAAAGLALGAGFLALSGAYARGDGFIPIVAGQRGLVDRLSPYEQASLAVRGVAPLGPGVELQTQGLVFSDARERGTAFSAIRTRGADGSIRLVGPRWSALAYVQTRDFYNSFASVNAARSLATRASEQYSVPSTGIGARAEWRPDLGPGLELRLGGDWRRTDGETRERYAFVAGSGTRGRAAGGTTDTLGAHAEAAWSSGPLTLTAGGRADHWTIDRGHLRERIFATGQVVTDTAFADRAGWEPTGRAGFALRASDGLVLRGAAYLGWRLPTLNELYRPFRAGADATAANADLSPERLKGIEAGLEWRPSQHLRFAATLFANRLDDAIANVTLGVGPGTFPSVGFVAAGGEYRQRRNLDSIAARGAELDGRLLFGPWSFTAGYSYVDGTVHAAGAAAPLEGLRPAQTPRHNFSSTLAWDGHGARAALTLRYVGNQFEDDRNLQRIPDAATFDAVASVPLGKHLSIGARAENLTNKLVVAGISGDGVVERATPRTLWLDLRWKTD